MARAKKSTKKRSPKQPSRLRGAWEGLTAIIATTGGNTGRIAAVGIPLAMLALWTLFLPRLEARVADLTPLSVDPQRIDLNAPVRLINGEPDPNLIPEPVANDLIARVYQHTAGAKIFDGERLQLASDALFASGWFAEPPTVARRPNGRIDIDGIWRTPTAVVVTNGRESLVGADAVWMAFPDGLRPSPAYFRIINPHESRPTAPGKPFASTAVEDAVRLIRLFGGEEALLRGIVAIDLSETLPSGRPNLLLRTARGATIVWGAPPTPPGDPEPGEITSQQKLQNVRAILERESQLLPAGGRIHANLPTVVIDNTAKGAPR